MRSILLDESVPLGLAKHLKSTTRFVRHVSQTCFAGMADPSLLRAAAADETDVFVTCDQSLVKQQHVAALPFGIVVICTNNWPTILGNRGRIIGEIDAVRPGSWVEVLKGAHQTRYGRTSKLSDPP